MKIAKMMMAVFCLVLSVNAQAQGFKIFRGGESTYYPTEEVDSIVFMSEGIWKNKSVAGHVAADLGLPSGTYWAKCNVGAEDEGETAAGFYFAWGETESKTIYNWTTYTLAESSSMINKYNAIDTLTTLEEYDDAVFVNWGGTWRQPTKDQIDELVNNCKWTWTTVKGVNGYKIVSLINGNSIFLPAVGYYDGNTMKFMGERGYYWSCELNTSAASARTIRFLSDGTHASNSGSRYYGFPVRGVTK